MVKTMEIALCDIIIISIICKENIERVLSRNGLLDVIK